MRQKIYCISINGHTYALAHQALRDLRPLSAGIPMIFVALYPEQEVLSINYEKLGFAKYLGLYKQLLPKHWATIISAYYSNNAIYSKMASELDRQSFIGLGPQNLANKINEICKAI